MLWPRSLGYVAIRHDTVWLSETSENAIEVLSQRKERISNFNKEGKLIQTWSITMGK